MLIARDELQTLYEAIEKNSLPPTFTELFAALWDESNQRFHVQENSILDYKECLPSSFSDSYGAGIVRLALAFHNTYGGIIVFGVQDRTLTVAGVNNPFDIESFNRFLSDFSGFSDECITKLYKLPGSQESKSVCAVLVPRRQMKRPVQLKRPLDRYLPGRTWVRDRHEVIDTDVRHLPLLYSERRPLLDGVDLQNVYPIHRSFPPSPATMKEFIARNALLGALWDWFVFSDQPRMYLHGPGGSGKSTLAFEFARQLADNGSFILAKDGSRVDYVIYLTAKETELDPALGRERKFSLRHFSTLEQEYGQILLHSGLIGECDTDTITRDECEGLLGELFSTFSGLIVLDDIDALSRRGLDTGEESLFIKAITARKRTRLLYTLRYPPSYALSSALSVPGLDPNTEFWAFLDACCSQFGVPQPPGDKIPHIQESTSYLPLLIETIIGLRRNCGNYTEAIRLFESRGGDEARRYLYQREYDNLDRRGRSRQILAALFLLEDPIGFRELADLFQFAPEEVRDALTECGSIFLSRFEDASGETLYQLSPPSRNFIKAVSKDLPYYGNLQVQVGHFRSEGEQSTPRDAAIIVRMRRLIQCGDFQGTMHFADGLPAGDTALLNPKVRALLGQAYSELGPNYMQKARECFRYAESFGYKDVFMMRRWYNMEFHSGYGLTEAERICQVMVDDKMPPRTRSEFWSKLGACHLYRATSTQGVSRERAIDQLRHSALCYLEGMYIGSISSDFDNAKNLEWLDVPLRKLVRNVDAEPDEFMRLFDLMVERKHDVPKDGAQAVMQYFSKLRPRDGAVNRAKIKGYCQQRIARIKQVAKPLERYPGFEVIIEGLENIIDALSEKFA